jgi:hypothetical protein
MERTLTLALPLLAVGALAQPAILESAYLPNGTTMDVSVHSGAIPPGGAGAGQIWDLSSLTYNPVGVIGVADPASTPCASTFPSSNMSYVVPNGTWHYFIRTTTDLQWQGMNWPSSCVGGLTFTDPRKVIDFPFNYQDSFTDTYAGDDGSSGSVTVEYDGHGTLITPFGTFNNVARIKSTDGANVDYAWLSDGFPQYGILQTIDGNSSTLVFTSVVTGLAERSTTEPVVVAPNPASDRITISDVPPGATVTIADPSGRTLQRGFATDAATIVDISPLPAGIYFVRWEGGGRMGSRKLIVQPVVRSSNRTRPSWSTSTTLLQRVP